RRSAPASSSSDAAHKYLTTESHLSKTVGAALKASQLCSKAEQLWQREDDVFHVEQSEEQSRYGQTPPLPELSEYPPAEKLSPSEGAAAAPRRSILSEIRYSPDASRQPNSRP